MLKATKLAMSIFFGAFILIVVLAGLPQTDVSANPLDAPLMTRAIVTTTEVLYDGVDVDLLAATADGEKFTNTGKEFFFITNDYTDTVTATFVTAGTFGGFAIEDVTVPISASYSKLVGPFNIAIFNQKSGDDKNTIYVNWDSVGQTGIASITVRAYKLDDGS